MAAQLVGNNSWNYGKIASQVRKRATSSSSPSFWWAVIRRTSSDRWYCGDRAAEMADAVILIALSLGTNTATVTPFRRSTPHCRRRPRWMAGRLVIPTVTICSSIWTFRAKSQRGQLKAYGSLSQNVFLGGFRLFDFCADLKCHG